MIKKMSIITIILVVIIFAGCGSAVSDVSDLDIQENTHQIVSHSDTVFFGDLREMLLFARAYEEMTTLSVSVVRARVIDERTGYRDRIIGNMEVTTVVAFNRIEILEVFHGKMNQGDVVEIGQRVTDEDWKLFNEATHLVADDDVILFLITDEDGINGLLHHAQGAFFTPPSLSSNQSMIGNIVARSIELPPDLVLVPVHTMNDLVLTVNDLAEIYNDELPQLPTMNRTITFNSDANGTFVGGKYTVVQEVQLGNRITQVPQPQPNFGYEFTGWLHDGVNWPISSQAVMALQITEDITFTAQYEPLFGGYDHVTEVILEGVTDFNIWGPESHETSRDGMVIYQHSMMNWDPVVVGIIEPITTDNGVPGYRILLDTSFFYVFDNIVFVDDGVPYSITVRNGWGGSEHYYTDFLGGQDPWQNQVGLSVGRGESYLSEWGFGWMRVIDEWLLEFEVIADSRAGDDEGYVHSIGLQHRP